MITINGTKQKEETYGLIAKAWNESNIGDDILIIQPNDQGGKSLEKTLLRNFENLECESKNKARHIMLSKTDKDVGIIDEWFEHTKLHLVESTGFYSMPGLFGWNKIDAGSELLVNELSDLRGVGADFGCGYGYLAKHALKKFENIKILHAFDYDSRAIDACTANVIDDRATIKQADCTKPIDDLNRLDFVIMNPPFHSKSCEDRTIGQRFIQTASHHLKPKGICWIVANTHMPYEDVLKSNFTHFTKTIEQKGFKILKATK